jgi:hypothetical protein
VRIDQSKSRHAGLLRYGAIAVLLLLSGATWAAEPGSDPLVTRRMQNFYEVYTGRTLTKAEAHALGEEFVSGHTRGGKNPAGIRAVAGEFGLHTILLREEKDRAAALSLRHRLLEVNYFRPEMQNTFELRLMTEPDPVRVVDARSGHLMTQRDVIALANLWHFAQRSDSPRHRELSRAQVDELVALLNSGMSGARGQLPQFFGEAAPYWAGVRQLWPYLPDDQKRLARAYILNTWRVRMPVELYAALLGIEREHASRRWAADVALRIRGRDETVPGLGRVQAAAAAMFDR